MQDVGDDPDAPHVRLQAQRFIVDDLRRFKEKPEGNCHVSAFMCTQTFKSDQLTYKLRRSKDVLELHACFDLVGQAEIDEFDSGQRGVLVQHHDVFRLQTQTFTERQFCNDYFQ